MRVDIEVLNPIWSRCTSDLKIIAPCLSYPSTVWVHAQSGKRPKTFDQCIMKKNGMFYTGWIPKLEHFCKKHGYRFQVTFSNEHRKICANVKPTCEPILPPNGNFKCLRPDQERQIKAAIKGRRGVIVAPMGLGKTILALAIMKAFSGFNILFLCPNLSILTKTIQDLKNFGFKQFCQLGDGQKHITDKIVVATMQTMRNMPLDELTLHFDVILIDEMHIAMEEFQTYEKILGSLAAPIRLGFTATAPKQKEQALISEGLLGPIIDKIDFEEAFDMGLIVKPTVSMILLPKFEGINSNNYQKVFNKAIVSNKARNRWISRLAEEMVNEGRKVLIFSTTQNTEHGHLIQKAVANSGLKIEYVYGDISAVRREDIINDLTDGYLDCVIADKVWREGVNIPSVNGIIMAASGKGEEEQGENGVIQFVGRGTRKHDGKIDLKVYDFFDPYRYVAEHSIERVGAYTRSGFEVKIR